MINDREFSIESIQELQIIIKEAQNTGYAQAAVETEYALFRTEECILEGVHLLLRGKLTEAFRTNNLCIKDICGEFEVGITAGLLIMNALLTKTIDEAQINKVGAYIAEEYGYSRDCAYAMAACSLSGFNNEARLGLEKMRTDILNASFGINGLTIEDARNEFQVDDYTGLCILNISVDNMDYFKLPIWVLPIDEIRITGETIRQE